MVIKRFLRHPINNACRPLGHQRITQPMESHFAQIKVISLFANGSVLAAQIFLELPYFFASFFIHSCETYTDLGACLPKSHGKTGRHFGIAVGPTHSSRGADRWKWPLCMPISIFSLRLRPPCCCDSSLWHATPLPATLQLVGSTQLSFLYRARIAD